MPLTPDLELRLRTELAERRVALRDVQCPRCNGHGRPRIIALSHYRVVAAAVDLKTNVVCVL
jgi:hypothetical protein